MPNTLDRRFPAGPLGSVSATWLPSLPLFAVLGVWLHSIGEAWEWSVMFALLWTFFHRGVLLPATRRLAPDLQLVDHTGTAWRLVEAARAGALSEAELARLLVDSERAGEHCEQVRRTALLGADAILAAQGSPLEAQVRRSVAASLDELLTHPRELDATVRQSFDQLTRSGPPWQHAQAELDQVVNLSGGDDPAEPHGSAIIERSRALAEQFEQESGLLRATRDELRPRVEPDGPTTTDQGSP